MIVLITYSTFGLAVSNWTKRAVIKDNHNIVFLLFQDFALSMDQLCLLLSQVL